MDEFIFQEESKEQIEAITTTEGPILILSSPGTGKTFTLVKRIVFLISEKGINPENIIFATFTDRAASEIIYALSKELSKININIDKLYIGTFNSICFKIYKQYINNDIDTVIDKVDERTLISQNIRYFKAIAGYDLLFKNKISPWKQAGELANLINSIREEVLDIKQFINNPDKRIRAGMQAVEIYNRLLQDNNLIDFIGVQIKVLEIFRENAEILIRIIKNFQYIIVDEYNFSRYIQEELIFMLGIDNENICVAGNNEEDKCTFIGDKVRNIIEFPYKFTVNKCKIIELAVDYSNNKNIKYFHSESIHKELNYILYGPPGTGKTYNTVNYAVAFIENKEVEVIQKEDYQRVRKRYNNYLENGQVVFTTFHQSYGYEDFIEGIKPILDSNELNYRLESGVFKNLCNIASSDENYNYVIIIDEINRGNVSKIFGELITLIENSKRKGNIEEVKTILPYSKEEFSVPNNIFLLGTMNTADRSIALLDTALRRRFKFIEMLPDERIIKNMNDNMELDIKGININKMLRVINRRIEVLYDRDHTIGHSFCMDLIKDSTIENLQNVFIGKIIPLLQEYFHDDYEKIRLVLADNQVIEQDKQFIIISQIEEELFGSNFELDEYIDKGIYQINIDAFSNPEAYIKIYGGDEGNEK